MKTAQPSFKKHLKVDQSQHQPVFGLWGECMRMAFEDHIREISEAGRNPDKLSEIITKQVVRDAWYIFISKTPTYMTQGKDCAEIENPWKKN